MSKRLEQTESTLAMLLLAHRPSDAALRAALEFGHLTEVVPWARGREGGLIHGELNRVSGGQNSFRPLLVSFDLASEVGETRKVGFECAREELVA